MSEKIGIAITTYNSEEYFQTLLESIPEDCYDLMVVVNGGESYKTTYSRKNLVWIQHAINHGPAKSRNDGLKYLYDQGIEYFFIIEDDMIVKSPEIFKAYIDAYKKTGLQYFCFASYAWEVGPVGARTPRFQAQYSNDLMVNFYKHSCNEFTFRTRKMLEKSGYYDERLRYIFDVDNYYNITKLPDGHCFWYSPDLSNSDDLIMNNPVAVSRLDGDNKRHEKLAPDYMLFGTKHQIMLNQIIDLPQHEVINKLRWIKNSK